MTQNLTSDEQQSELSWEEAVRRYLEEHPDFFHRHPDALARLQLRHETDGPAVSLIERQVRVLREENASLSRQLNELVAIARENDVLAARLHRFALAMADSASLDDVFDNAHEMLRREFKLDAVAIVCKGEAPPAFARPEFVGEDPRLRAVLEQHGGPKPACGAGFDESLMRYLFAERAAEVRSAALIALGSSPTVGLLALGAHDPHRFHVAMGTVYLAKLGDILMHSIARFLPAR
jgi:uncharacterized protein YigA (DUF484 family)